MEKKLRQRMIVLRVVAKLFVPLILLFALYVQFHGDYGPGGGFQAGVIFATGFIVYGLAYGRRRAEKVIPSGLLPVLMAVGILIYAFVGIGSMVFGGMFLEYDVLSDDPVHGQYIGIMLIELGVGVTVSAVMVAIYFSFVGRGKKRVKRY